MSSKKYNLQSLLRVITIFMVLANALGGTNAVSVAQAASNTWTATGSLATPRYLHTATLLSDGRVLVAGGANGPSIYASAELYNPATGTWTATGSLSTPRYLHTATLLSDGRVLVAGGAGASGSLASAELYDPATGTWTPTGSLNVARGGEPTATLLPNGKVLLAGGSPANDGVNTDSAELYDPATGTWAVTGSMTINRSSHTATLLPNDKVLVAGGGSTWGTLNSAELYDPATGTWTATGSMAQPRLTPTATLLQNGKVLLAGGTNTSSAAELYDPASGTWNSTGASMPVRYYSASALLQNGKVLIADGSGLVAHADLYDPTAGSWTATGALNTARIFHTMTLLPDGTALVVGGSMNSGPTPALASAELYGVISPIAITSAATSITSTGATLNGTVNPNGFSTDSSFQYSTDATLISGVTTIPAQTGLTGTTDVAVNANVTGLTPGTTYYYRAVGTNANGTSQDGILSFTTASAALPVPEINIKGNSVSIVDGDVTPSLTDHTDFGSADVTGGTVERVFTIENLGTADLTLGGTPKVVISGTNAADFTVTVQPSSPVAASGSTAFTVHFDPSAIGARNATVSIANDDADENPYNFDITGTGTVAPEMDLFQGATAITDGGSQDFGSRALNSNTDIVFTIKNTGAGSLTFTTPITIGGADAAQFSIRAPLASSPIAAGGSATFTVRFKPTSTGAKTATISIPNNDSNENPYDLTLTRHGRGGSPGLQRRWFWREDRLRYGNGSYRCRRGRFQRRRQTRPGDGE